jgi:hypothetical protein
VRPIAALAVVCLTSACSLVAEPQAPAITAAPVEPERARLVVYRPAATHLLGIVGDRPVAIGQLPACALGDGHFFVRDVDPGAITVDDGASRLTFSAAGGQRYFVRVGFNPQRGSLAGWVLPLVGYGPDASAPPGPETGKFAIETVTAASATVELAHVAPQPACP